MQNCMDAKKKEKKRKEEIPTVLIFVSDKNTLTGEALEMWDAVWGGETRAVGNVFQTWTDRISLGKNSTEKKKRKKNWTAQNSLFHLRLTLIGAIYLHVLLSHPFHFILTAAYSSVC